MTTLCDMLDVTRITGFLICIPMLEEWSNEGHINDLEGWAFQVLGARHLLLAPG